MGLPKIVNGAVGATVSFSHSGPGGNYEVGFGIAQGRLVGHNAVLNWFFVTKPISAHLTPTIVNIPVDSFWPAGLPNGDFDCLKFIQVPGGQHDPGGDFFIIAGWDDDVFTQAAPIDVFASLSAVYR